MLIGMTKLKPVAFFVLAALTARDISIIISILENRIKHRNIERKEHPALSGG